MSKNLSRGTLVLEKCFTWKRPHFLEVARRIAAEVWGHAVLVLVIAGGLVAMPHISSAGEAVGVDRSASQVVFSLLFVALVLPARRWLHSEVDRLFFAGRFRQARKIQGALRRYVPEAVAGRLESGHELECSEWEISVLFADLCGFTSFCELHTPTEIFTTVNRLMAGVCKIVRDHGGHVVEFGGDGIMAIFGAPSTLPQKERAAVDAARSIVAAINSICGSSGELAGGGLPVSVGIATGTDFVGNIQANHLIWTAIGNTTNLAARLQELTKDLNAAIIIDGRTHTALGEASVAFEPHNVPIRGRHNAEDVYVSRLSPKLESENPPPGATLEKPETYIVQRDAIANL